MLQGVTTNVQVRNDRKPISYGTKDLLYVDESDMYYDSDDNNYYNDDDSAWDRDMYCDASADEFVENHW